MDRTCRMASRSPACVPHTRGDGPHRITGYTGGQACSPHTWGWTAHAQPIESYQYVFPTHVGMDRNRKPDTTRSRSVPHTRGDGPKRRMSMLATKWCSPHTWGWTAYAGLKKFFKPCSPHTWGWTGAECHYRYTRRRVPHTRGDGPNGAGAAVGRRMCSPHTWGWTVPEASRRPRYIVFPTHVGMDRFSRDFSSCCSSVPHTRGDGPAHVTGTGVGVNVFPTHVGMDRTMRRSVALARSVPHTRGDGPLSVTK